LSVSDQTDLFLYAPEPDPNDVRLGDPTVARASGLPTSVTAGVGALALAGLAPAVAVSNNQNALPGVGVLTVTGLAPTAVLIVRALPGVGGLTLTGLAPAVAVSNNQVVLLGVGAVVVSGQAPAVAVSNNIAVTADVGVLTLTGMAPSVVLGIVVTADVGALVLSGLAPTVAATQNAQALPDVGVLILAGFAPDVQGDPVTIVPGGGFIQAIRRPKQARITVWTYEEFAPTVLIAPAQRFRAVVLPKPVAVTTGAGALALIGYAPSVIATLDDLSPTLDFADVRSGGSVPVSRVVFQAPRSHEFPARVASEVGPLADEEPPTVAVTVPVTPRQPVLAASEALPVVVSPLTGQLALTAFAPSVDIYGAPWSPDENTYDPFDDAAFWLVALDYMEMV
jgi:hypothetical protein